ncbi:MAG TPA: alpha/beta hydrolase domain-containing protein [Xanthobacteraceae bacterium]|nr:alpha/beta hydrolase domain-containing protein [Xanthobacteraceae bacterium]
MRRIITAALFLTVACLSSPAAARVERIEILSRQDFAPGIEFGDAGAYEKLRGRAFFALDPNAAANAPVTDLKLAPRDARGLVEFSAEFLVLRPKVTARGNGTLLYEVNNRGNIAILRQLHEASFSNDPATVADAGNGFLFRRGVTLVWSAWATDVATRPGDNRLVLRAPIATKDGAPITGKVAYELIVDAPRATARFTGLLGTAYPFANDGDPDVVLTERQRRADERRPIPRAAWSFVEPSEGGAASEIALEGGFKPGSIYELVYTARDPIVAAAGMAGIRDLLSYLRSNPLAGAPAPRTSLIFGISQSGRLIQTMLLRGLHVDEDGRAVFDGAFVHVAGGGKGGFDYRFAMPTRHFSVLEDHIYPTDFFPFATVSARDSATGAEGSILDRARALGAVPKLFYVNNSSEYWNRAASLIATDPDGERDLPPAPEARIYLIAGAQHYVGALSERGIFANCVNTLNHYRAMRALMLAFERWVRDGVEPPPSTYPRITDGTLVTVAAHGKAFPGIPDFRLPEGNLRPPRLDFGSRFETDRVAEQVPPRLGKPFATLVPRPDADGLDQGGIALPEVLLPLGTRTGFNTRNEAAGFPGATGRWDGSFLPFARTEAERQASGDPRPSLEARYVSRAAYEEKVRAAAADVVRRGFLLPQDVDALVSEAGGLYDRIMARDPADRSCRYLFDR